MAVLTAIVHFKLLRRIMADFFGLSKLENGSFGFLRSAEGSWSWQHILQVSILMVLMVGLAVFFGKKYKNESDKKKNLVLIACAILIISFEIVKIIVLCMQCWPFINWICKI
jgi:membrane-associated HD superfamily phosphohydrolase